MYWCLTVFGGRVAAALVCCGEFSAHCWATTGGIPSHQHRETYTSFIIKHNAEWMRFIFDATHSHVSEAIILWCCYWTSTVSVSIRHHRPSKWQINIIVELSIHPLFSTFFPFIFCPAVFFDLDTTTTDERQEIKMKKRKTVIDKSVRRGESDTATGEMGIYLTGLAMHYNIVMY